MYKWSVLNLKVLKGFYSLLGLLKRVRLYHFETHERTAHFRVPDTAIPSKAKL